VTWVLLFVAGIVVTVWVLTPAPATGWGPPSVAAVRPTHVGAAILVLLLPVVGVQAALFAAAGIAATGAARTLIRHAQHRRLRRRRELAVIELCDALAAELSSGVPALVALERACNVHPELSIVARGARLGVDVPSALHDLAARPGLEALRAIAAGWRVASHTGGGLANVLDNIGRGLRHDEDARSELEAALAPPRATARVLAVLPVFGLALGQSMGARPIAFLLVTTLGRVCLGVGLLLSVSGIVWVDLIARRAQEPS
jgi:tight adherence protein B